MIDQEVEGFYNENHKTLPDEIKTNGNIFCSGIGRVNITQSDLQIQCNIIKINSNDHFYRNETADPRIHMEFHKTLNSQNNIEQRALTL